MGVVDVEGMREAMSPEILDNWIAYHQLEPFGDDWLKAGVMAATVQNAVAALGAGLGGQTLSKQDMAQPTDFMPGDKPDPRPRGLTDPKLQEAALRAMVGL